MTAPLALCGDATTCPTVLPWVRALEHDPASLAVFPERGVDLSFEDAIAGGRRVAGALRAHGIGAGDRVAVVLGNRPEFIGVWLGALFVNACLAPVDPGMPAERLAALLEQLDPAATVTGGTEAEVRVQVGSRRLPYAALERHAPCEAIAEVEPTDITWMLFTGGTTGAPKGILLSHHFVRVFAECWIGAARLGEGDVHLQDLPFHHANGLLGLTMSLAVRRQLAVYMRFSVSRYWERVRESGATTTTWLGTMGHLVSGLPEAVDTTLDRVKWIPRPPDVRALESRLGMQIVESYGSTEAGIVAWAEGEDSGVGCGVAQHPYRIEIVSGDGESLTEPGQVGEIVVACDRDLCMCSGYWRDGALDLHGAGLREWRSGDLGERLADGTFRVVGRATGDIIRHKGENISSREIELAALRHPLVDEAAAVGVQAELGSDILLVCRPRDDVLTHEDLSRFLAQHLARQARPRYLAFTAELPKTVKQIIPKRELERFKADAWDAEAGRR